MRIKLTTAPAEEPITLVEAKAHLRVDGSAEDTLITALITSARQWAEDYLRRSLITQTWTVSLDAFLGSNADVIDLPFPPLQSVSSVKYVDTDGVQQTMGSADYVVDNNDTDSARIYLAYDKSWPSTRSQRNAVTVEFVTGYGAAATVPQVIKQAMLLMIGELFEHREETVVGTVAAKLPNTAKLLLAPYRVMSF